MMSKEKGDSGKNLCEEAVGLAQNKYNVDEVEVFYQHNISLEVKIEKNDIQVPKSDDYEGIGIRVFQNQKTGFASTNLLDKNSIEESIETAAKIASMAPEDENNILPEQREIEYVNDIYDTEAENLKLKDIIEKCRIQLSEIRQDERVVIDTGSFMGSFITRAIATSRGIKAEEKKTTFVNFALGFAREGEEVSSFDAEQQNTNYWSDLSPQKTGRELADRVVSSLGAEKISGFEGKVLLTPFSAVSLLVNPIVYAINAENVQNDMSPWKDKLSEKVASDKLTVYDDAFIEKGVGSKSFDREGLPPESLKIIEEGYLRNYLHNSYSAAEAGIVSNGHASGGAQSTPGIGTTNFCLQPGNNTLEKIISRIDRGLLVNRYSGSVDPVSDDFSGVVKGGHLIEDGEKVKPVKEVMISGNVYKLFNRILDVSSEVKNISSYRIPHILIDSVQITGN